MSAALRLLEGAGVRSIAGRPLEVAEADALEALARWSAAEGIKLAPKVSRQVMRRAEQWAGGAELKVRSSAEELVRPPTAGLSPRQRAEVEELVLDGVAAAELDHTRLREIVRAELDGRPVRRLEVGEVTVDLPSVSHERLERVLWLGRFLPNIYLVGPAGTGKTTMGAQVAHTLKRKFLGISCSAGLGESALLGRWLPVEAGGTWSYVIAKFVKAYRDGWVILLDEVDAADSNLLVVINAALANGYLDIQGYGRVERHPDTVIVCAANTFGTGASAVYVGREQLDAATLDRFIGAMVEVDYSDAVERAICGLKPKDPGERARSAPLSAAEAGERAYQWVRGVRGKVQEAGLRRIVSTRALSAYVVHAVNGEIPEFFRSFFCGWTDSEVQAMGDLAPAWLS